MSQTQPFRALLTAGTAGTVALLAACSSVPPPKEEMAVAKTTVDRVTAAPGTAASAAVELQAARDKLTRAQRAMHDKDYVQARRLAEQAQVDARLAESKAAAARGQQAVRELQESIRALNDELQRRAPQK
ncbi:MAG: DUF4398 domain-containing protein [Comamonadaceae bacterium]|nr:DUF4398 domain-containing protein [Comamonadaceae bacterium]RRD55813.1 DUF4398 domain-containing protein [Comamonadaceae bacterium OH2545_COT-014]